MTQKKSTGVRTTPQNNDKTPQQFPRVNLSYRLVIVPSMVEEIIQHLAELGYLAISANDPATATEKAYVYEVFYCVDTTDENFYEYVHALMCREEILKYEVF